MPRRKRLVDVSWKQLKRIAESSASPGSDTCITEESVESVNNQTASCDFEDIEAAYDGPSGSFDFTNTSELEDSSGQCEEREELKVINDASVEKYLFYDTESDLDNVQDTQEQNNETGPTARADKVSGKKTFLRRLGDWACRFKIKLNALTALLLVLCLLRPDFDWPKDGRTIMGTPRFTITKEIRPGRYWHRGLKHGLLQLIGDSDVSVVELNVNVDGLPISDSSHSALWPILCSVKHLGVFVVGIYHGYEKPFDANDYLEDFVQEANDLIVNGLHNNGKTITVKFGCLICDAPAKSFVMCTTGHNSKHGCTKCTVEGDFLNHRMSFLEINEPLRTDEGFRAGIDEDYHKSQSIFLSIHGFLPVTSVVLDYMHLVCEGVVKKILLYWLFGKLTVRLCARQIRKLNDAMTRCCPFIPKDFARHSRTFRFVKQWKATEFRQFILYTGPVVLQNILGKEVYDHFISLHYAITLLCDQSYSQDHLLVDYANGLLRHFVSKFKRIYGSAFVSHNVHNLVHLANDVKNYGSLDNFSSFPFESFLNKIKGFLRKSEKPLQQVMRRYTENENSLIREPTIPDRNQAPILMNKHECGKLLPCSVGPQYMKARFTSFVLDIEEDADRCCYLKDGTIIFIENFTYLKDTGEPVAVGRTLKKRGSLYQYPCDSKNIGIVVVRGKGKLRAWPLSQIRQKCVRLPMGSSRREKWAIFPLLHASV